MDDSCIGFGVIGGGYELIGSIYKTSSLGLVQLPPHVV
jgi:hypothetical protein